MENGGWLSDGHISLAQQVLSQQFPEISGLQSPLLALMNRFLPVMRCERSVQIHNIWESLGDILHEDDGELYLYDSSFSPGKLGIVNDFLSFLRRRIALPLHIS